MNKCSLIVVALGHCLLASNANARPFEECLEYAAEAKTQVAAKAIMAFCQADDSWLIKSKEFACAIKSGKASTEDVARAIFATCIKD